MADARMHYTCKMEVYIGKQPDGSFTVDNSSFAVVTRLISESSGSGRNVTFDNWYTSYPLVVSLLHDNKSSAAKTLRKNMRSPTNFYWSRTGLCVTVSLDLEIMWPLYPMRLSPSKRKMLSSSVACIIMIKLTQSLVT